MGLTLDYFYSLTPRQFFNTLSGWQRRLDENAKEHWLMARLVAFSAVSPYLDKNSPKSPEKWLPFVWEKKDTANTGASVLPTAEAHAEAEARWAAHDAKRAQKKV